MSRQIRLAAAASLVALALSPVAHAAPELKLIERPAERFDRLIEVHALELRYRGAVEVAERHRVSPRRPLVGGAASPRELRRAIGQLRERVAAAKRRAAAAFGTLAGGVSPATLESIATCESGDDPTAVNGSGYYGKYQFDLGTWASVGGAGNPAEASEAEQDYRASLLYSRAGSSPWPNCG